LYDGTWNSRLPCRPWRWVPRKCMWLCYVNCVLLFWLITEPSDWK
jgi:hypothetical protein